jgi:hypothetical protein
MNKMYWKGKKFWGVAGMNLGGRFIASIVATYATDFYTNSVTSGTPTSFNFSLTLPNIPAGALLAISMHCSNSHLATATFDPTGQNIAMTQEVAGAPTLFDAVLPSGLTTGTYTLTVTVSSGNFQFARAGIVAWYIIGQTQKLARCDQICTGKCRHKLWCHRWSGNGRIGVLDVEHDDDLVTVDCGAFSFAK